jgi:hypothetical protein
VLHNNAQILYTDIRILFKIYPLSPVFLFFYVKVYIILDLITHDDLLDENCATEGRSLQRNLTVVQRPYIVLIVVFRDNLLADF